MIRRILRGDRDVIRRILQGDRDVIRRILRGARDVSRRILRGARDVSRRILRGIGSNTPGVFAVASGVAFLKATEALALVRASGGLMVIFATDATGFRLSLVPNVTGIAFNFDAGWNIRG